MVLDRGQVAEFGTHDELLARGGRYASMWQAFELVSGPINEWTDVRTMNIMKVAEALALRADATRRVEQLRTRIVANARYQEGEEPSEDARALLTEVRRGARRARGA